MRKQKFGSLIFDIVAIICPLLYLLMYCPVWGGKQLMLSGGFLIGLFVFQCLCLLAACVRLFAVTLPDREGGWQAGISGVLSVLSVLLLCFAGSIFCLELFDIPWFPAQG